MSVVSNEMCF